VSSQSQFSQVCQKSSSQIWGFNSPTTLVDPNDVIEGMGGPLSHVVFVQLIEFNTGSPSPLSRRIQSPKSNRILRISQKLAKTLPKRLAHRGHKCRLKVCLGSIVGARWLSGRAVASRLQVGYLIKKRAFLCGVCMFSPCSLGFLHIYNPPPPMQKIVI